MPLENDSWAENAPLSDSDSYTNNPDNPYKRTIRIDASRLSKPMPIFGKLLGFNEELITKGVQIKANNAAQVLGRQPTDVEINALAYWTSKQISILSYAAPLGVTGGLWRCYDTAATFRFPFFQPNLEIFKKEIFPHSAIPMIRGNSAVIVWHLTRALLYGYVGNSAAKLVFASYSISVGAVGEASDPTLKEYIAAMRKKAMGTTPAVSQPPARGPQRAPVPVSAPSQPQQDDASPTGGMFGTDAPEGFLGRYEGGESEPPAQQQPQWKPTPQSRPAPVQTQTTEAPSQPFDMFGGEDSPQRPDQQGVVPDTRPQQGSSWDRIRRGQQPAGQGQGGWDSVRKKSGPGESEWSRQENQEQKAQKQGSTYGETYSISKRDEEKGYAKEEAQKEFDARIERERQGGDFGEKSKR